MSTDLKDERVAKARKLVTELESLDGMKNASLDDYNELEFSLFATPEEDANLHSLSQRVRNTLEDNDSLYIKWFNTPSETRQNWYDIEMTVL